MTNYLESGTYSRAGDWLMGTVRRHPEAVLLLAAGCALLMRSTSGSSARTSASTRHHGGHGRDTRPNMGTSAAEDRLSRGAEGATAYAADMKNRVAETAGGYAQSISDTASGYAQSISDTAGSYAESVSQFAQDARRSVSESSEHLRRQAQTGMNRVLNDQPLAVAVAGLAAGAALAAAFPSTKLEGRTLGGAHEALTGAVGKAGEQLVEAAGRAGERLKAAAVDRVLGSEGLKNLASDVVGAVTDAVSGKSEDHSRVTTVPQGPGSQTKRASSGSGSASGTTHGGSLAGTGSTPAGTGVTPGSRSNR